MFLKMWALFLSSVVSTTSEPISCLIYNHSCVQKCPRGMHRFDSNCGFTYTQSTCDSPQSADVGLLCHWSRCDCNRPKVLDETSGLCYDLKDCPKRCEGDMCDDDLLTVYDYQEYHSMSRGVLNENFQVN